MSRELLQGQILGGKIGKFELANNGVIFLDEIGDMPIYLQSKILRVIQDKK
jgi:Transcriptional regulator containing PAS, AAA-type ATPase, and DNA-binding domains